MNTKMKRYRRRGFEDAQVRKTRCLRSLPKVASASIVVRLSQLNVWCMGYAAAVPTSCITARQGWPARLGLGWYTIMKAMHQMAPPNLSLKPFRSAHSDHPDAARRVAA